MNSNLTVSPRALGVLATAGLLALTAIANAQADNAATIQSPAVNTEPQPGTMPGAGASETQGPLTVSFSARGIAELQTDFKSGPGTVSVYRADFELGMNYKFNNTLSAGLVLDVQTSWFNFNNAQALTPGSPKPYGSFAEVTIAPSLRCTPDEHWSFTVGALIDFSGEFGADVGQSFAGGGFLAAGYKFSDQFNLTLGVVGISRIEDSFYAYPYVGIDWKINEKVSFKVYGNQNGPEARITAKVAEAWSVFLYGAYQARSYRLSDTSPVPDGVFREREVPVVFGATYQCCEKFEINGGVGVVAWRRYRQDNSAGLTISQLETEPGPMLFLGGKITF
ncbi:MAG: DUF6268 family outer membrane beta-barrel protein [Phycisphaerales bacterium]